MACRLVFERAAEKAPKKKVRPDRAERIREALVSLTEDPRPRSSRKLKLQNTENRRLRVRDQRIIYFVEEAEDADGESSTDYVLDVGHQQGIYK